MSELFECISLLSSGLARARRATCGRRAGGVDVPAGTCLRVMCLRVTFLRVTCLAPSSPRARPKLAPSSPWAHHFPSVRSGSSRSAREGCVVSYHPDREIIGDSDHGTRTNPRDEIASTPSATSQPPPRPHLTQPPPRPHLTQPPPRPHLSHPLGHISATPSATSQPPCSPRPSATS
jgi:hypothetical protein